MADIDLHRPLYTADLLANALNQGGEAPLLHIQGMPTLSAREVRDRTSQFVQAMASLGAGRGVRVALLSPNRPESLHVSNAAQLLAAIYVPLHPLGSADDQLHVLRDAEVEVLIFDAERFEGRVRELAPQLQNMRLLAVGASDLAPDICALADTFTPAPLVPPRVEPHDVMRMGYSGGTTGKPKALMSCQRTAMATGQIMQAEWECPIRRIFSHARRSATRVRRCSSRRCCAGARCSSFQGSSRSR